MIKERNTLSGFGKSASVGVLLGLVLLVANAWVQYLLWFGDQGLVRWRQTQKQLQDVRGEVQDAEKRIQRIKDEILFLEKSDVALEEVARRDLGMVYPDEILFIVPQE